MCARTGKRGGSFNRGQSRYLVEFRSRELTGLQATIDVFSWTSVLLWLESAHLEVKVPFPFVIWNMYITVVSDSALGNYAGGTFCTC